MSRRANAVPPPTPEQRAKRRKKLLAIGGIVLVGVAALVYFVLPIILLVTPNTKTMRIAQKVEDTNNIRQMVGVMISDGADAAPDGRVDVYKALLATTDNPQQLVEICRGARTGKGATIEQIRGGDYSQFPFVRAKGTVTLEMTDRPLLWDAAPREDGERVVGLANGAAMSIPEAEFQKLTKKFDLK